MCIGPKPGDVSRDGVVDRASVINSDGLHTIAQTTLTARVGKVDEATLARVRQQQRIGDPPVGEDAAGPQLDDAAPLRTGEHAAALDDGVVRRDVVSKPKGSVVSPLSWKTPEK